MPSFSIWAQVAASCSQASDAPSPEQAMASTSGYSGFSAEFPTATAHIPTILHLALGMSLCLAKHTLMQKCRHGWSSVENFSQVKQLNVKYT